MNRIARFMLGAALSGASWVAATGARAAEQPEALAAETRVFWTVQRRTYVRATEGWYRIRLNAREFMGAENPGNWSHHATVLLYTGPGGPLPDPTNVRLRVLLYTGEYPSVAKGFEAVANSGKTLVEKLKYRSETIYPGGLPVSAFRSPMQDRTRFFVILPLGLDVVVFVLDLPRPEAEFPAAALKLIESLTYSLVAPEAQDPPPPPPRRPNSRTR